jgi:DNA repair exonuclease SbcCD nuclease subunit
VSISFERRPLRLIHTSDVHIGDEVNPAKRLAGLAAAVEATLNAGADALLVAGDFFDNARIHVDDIEAAFAQLQRLTVPVIVANGNHDCLGPPSIHDRVRLADAGDHVFFLDEPDGSHTILAGLGLSIWSRAMVEHHAGFSPLLGHSRPSQAYWHVAMAHGHYFPTGALLDRSSPILQTEIGALDCDYLALGHWHRYLDVSHEGTPAYYCGAPSEPGGSFPSVNLVTLDPKGPVEVTRIPLQLE